MVEHIRWRWPSNAMPCFKINTFKRLTQNFQSVFLKSVRVLTGSGEESPDTEAEETGDDEHDLTGDVADASTKKRVECDCTTFRVDVDDDDDDGGGGGGDGGDDLSCLIHICNSNIQYDNRLQHLHKIMFSLMTKAK